MQRSLPLMFIVSILAAAVAFAEPPSQASRYQQKMGARYGRDAYSQRSNEGRRPDHVTASPTREPARGQVYVSHAGQPRNVARPYQSDRRGNDHGDGQDYGRADNRYPRPGFGDSHRDEREGYRNAGWNRDRHGRDWYDRYRVDHFRFDGDRYYARQRFTIGYYYAPWGYTTRLWACGDRLPQSYYGGRYVVDDYYNYDLYTPSYATAWVRVGDDALLIDMENGEVLDVVADLFW